MSDRVPELLLAACREAGALQVYVLLYELQALAQGKDEQRDFTTNEAVRFALKPEHARLKHAIAAVCGEIDARYLAKVLSRWRGKDVGLPYVIDSIGLDQGLILWKFRPVNPLPAHTCPVKAGTMATLLSQESSP